MSYNAEHNFPEIDRVFAPPLYTEESLAVIREHLGENPNTAINDITADDLGLERWHFKDVTDQKNNVLDSADAQFDAAVRNETAAVRAALQRFYDLEDLQNAGQRKWVGPEEIKAAIDIWCTRQNRYRETKHQNPEGIGHHPELHTHDRRGHHFAAPGTDAERPRKYDVELYQVGTFSPTDFTEGLGDKVAPEQPEEIDFKAIETIEEGIDFRECPLPGCNYRKEFKKDSQLSYGRAGTAVRTHMRMTRDRPDDHKEALVMIKGQT